MGREATAVKLTGGDLRALASELRLLADGLEDVADTTEDADRPFHYPDHAVTVRLFELLNVRK